MLFHGDFRLPESEMFFRKEIQLTCKHQPACAAHKKFHLGSLSQPVWSFIRMEQFQKGRREKKLTMGQLIMLTETLWLIYIKDAAWHAFTGNFISSWPRCMCLRQCSGHCCEQTVCSSYKRFIRLESRKLKKFHYSYPGYPLAYGCFAFVVT